MPTSVVRTVVHLTDKFANAVLFILSECSAPPGLTVLLKLMFRADSEHYRHHLRPITGLTYIALERGPVPDDYRDLMRALEARGYVELDPVELGAGLKRKERFRACRAFDATAFESSELEVLRRVVADHGHKTGAALSAEAHDETPWKAVWRDGEGETSPIPFALARWGDNRCTGADLTAAVEDVRDPAVQRAIAEIERAAE